MTSQGSQQLKTQDNSHQQPHENTTRPLLGVDAARPAVAADKHHQQPSLGLSDEEEGETMGRRRAPPQQQERAFTATPPSNVAEIELAPAVKQPKKQAVQTPPPAPAVKKDDLIDELMESADKQTHILFIPHFSDVGRINEKEAEEIMEEVEEELKDEMRSRQVSQAASKQQQNAIKMSNRTTKDEFTPREVMLTNKLLESKPPEKETLPPKEKPCCSTM